MIFLLKRLILFAQHKKYIFNEPIPASVRIFYTARLKIRLNFCFWAKKNLETILSPLTGAQTVTPIEGADFSAPSSCSIRIIYRDIGLVDSAMQPDEQQPKILPPLSEVIPFPA